MDLIVARTPDGWTAHDGESVVGQAVAFMRPDGRCFIAFRSCRAEAYRPLVLAIAEHLQRDLHTEIDDADADVRARLVGLGFVISRRDHSYTIPTDPTVTGLSNVAVPAGFEVVTADRVDEDLLRELDDDLKQDVPGTDGWKWDRQGFRKETYDAPDFDPATYLVAIEQASGGYAGLVRVWNRPGGPRLGLIAVGRPYRRRGLARSLLTQAFGVLHDRGKAEVVAEVDVTNTGSNRLLAGLGARRIGGSIEMIRPWPGGTA